MKGLIFPLLIGIFISFLGLTTTVGWYAHLPGLISIWPQSSHMIFNTGLAFILSGLTLMLTQLFSQAKVQFYILGGIALIALTSVTLMQYITGSSLGIDTLFVQPWLVDDNPYPGRMSVSGSLAFLLTGFTFLLLAFPQGKSSRFTAQFFILGILLIGVSSLFGYLLDLRMLRDWYHIKPLSLQSATGITLLGFGLWWIWTHQIHQKTGTKDDNKLLMLGGLIIGFFLLVTSMIAYSVFLNDNSTLFSDMREKSFLIILLAITVGMFLLYWQAIPMVHAVIHSKKDLQSANQRLKESENRFRSAFDNASIGMALISLGGRCIKVNQSLCQILGMKEDELINADLRTIMHKEDLKKDFLSIEQMIEGEVKTYRAEQRFIHKSGEILWILVNMSLIYDALGHPLYFISQFQNVSAEKRAEEQLRRMAYHDPLTGLANRNKLEQYLQQLITTSGRHHPSFALIFLDLDHFKNVNDTVGHDAGDLLLQVVAERLKTTIRDTDIVARLGGDEFVLVITNIKKVESVALIAQKILNNLLKPIVIKGHEIYTTTSIGISLFPHDGEDLETLMKNADLALYRAKEQGRNNYQFCTPEMTAKAQDKMKRQNALSHALVTDEFLLNYQPKMDLKTNKICGVEGLLRWKNKEFGMVSTEEIISLSEESGLIISLSEWILKTACKQVKAWRDAGFPLTAAINLSPRQFKQSTFVSSILQILDETDFPANCLELEITESLIMQDAENTLRTLEEFKRIGIKIAIDDFGTGYSSMNYLRRFAIDKIKIDKSFVQQIPNDESNISIVSAMIAMAHKLGIKTIAEGIETKQQYEFLFSEECDEMQGYYLSRPLSASAMTEFLSYSAGGVKLSDEPKHERA